MLLQYLICRMTLGSLLPPGEWQRWRTNSLTYAIKYQTVNSEGYELAEHTRNPA